MAKSKYIFILVALVAVLGMVVSIYFNFNRPRNLGETNNEFKDMPEVVEVVPGESNAGNINLSGQPVPAPSTTSAMTTLVAQAPTPAVDFSKVIRDPFANINIKINEDETSPAANEVIEEVVSLHLWGIWGSNSANRYAIIDNEVLKVGDKIYNYVVKSIDSDQVVLTKDGVDRICDIGDVPVVSTVLAVPVAPVATVTPVVPVFSAKEKRLKNAARAAQKKQNLAKKKAKNGSGE